MDRISESSKYLIGKSVERAFVINERSKRYVVNVSISLHANMATFAYMERKEVVEYLLYRNFMLTNDVDVMVYASELKELMFQLSNDHDLNWEAIERKVVK